MKSTPNQQLDAEFWILDWNNILFAQFQIIPFQF